MHALTTHTQKNTNTFIDKYTQICGLSSEKIIVLKIKKYGAGASLCKKGAGTFPISFFQGLSFLHIEVILHFVKLCSHLKKNHFFLPP